MNEIDNNKTRQGRWGTQVVLVLVCGLILASLGWLIAENFSEAIDSVPTAGGTGEMNGQQQPAGDQSNLR